MSSWHKMLLPVAHCIQSVHNLQQKFNIFNILEANSRPKTNRRRSFVNTSEITEVFIGMNGFPGDSYTNTCGNKASVLSSMKEAHLFLSSVGDVCYLFHSTSQTRGDNHRGPNWSEDESPLILHYRKLWFIGWSAAAQTFLSLPKCTGPLSMYWVARKKAN